MGRKATPLRLISTARVSTEKDNSRINSEITTRTPTKKPRLVPTLFFSEGKSKKVVYENSIQFNRDNIKSLKKRVVVKLGSDALEKDPIVSVDDTDHRVEKCLYIRNINMELTQLGERATEDRTKRNMGRKATPLRLISTARVSTEKDNSRINSEITTRTPTKKPRLVPTLFFSEGKSKKVVYENSIQFNRDNIKSLKKRVVVKLGSDALEKDPIVSVDDTDHRVEKCLYIRNINMELSKHANRKYRNSGKEDDKEDNLDKQKSKISSETISADKKAKAGTSKDRNMIEVSENRDNRPRYGNWGAKSLRLPKSRLFEDISVIEQNFDSDTSKVEIKKSDKNGIEQICNKSGVKEVQKRKRNLVYKIEQELESEKNLLVDKHGYTQLNSFPIQHFRSKCQGITSKGGPMDQGTSTRLNTEVKCRNTGLAKYRVHRRLFKMHANNSLEEANIQIANPTKSIKTKASTGTQLMDKAKQIEFSSFADANPKATGQNDKKKGREIFKGFDENKPSAVGSTSIVKKELKNLRNTQLAESQEIALKPSTSSSSFRTIDSICF
ncbi:hypothetical protein BB561_001950 [Smittium simulii]|uniref:Uncharacterized protein n=1 Tax=Smittium simulii TaxID=133385 RepID=A0A2T9YSA6_9FUNG|nr:hypothetical protein BB561_001950 [Smittium simulii]